MRNKFSGILITSVLAVAGVISASPASASVPSISTWTPIDGFNITTAGQGSSLSAEVVRGGTLPHAYANSGIGAENLKKHTLSPYNVSGLNYELYRVGDFVQANFSGAGTTDVKVLLGWINVGDEVLITASTDGTNFTPVDLSDTNNVAATAITSNSLPTLSSSSPGVFAPSMANATAYGGSYQVHFATAIKAIRVENHPIIAGSDTTPMNGIGFMIPGALEFNVLAATSDPSKGSATSTDSDHDGTWDLVATANSGYEFSSWSCTDSQVPASVSSATTTLTQSSPTPTHNATCTASFRAVASTPSATALATTGSNMLAPFLGSWIAVLSGISLLSFSIYRRRSTLK